MKKNNKWYSIFIALLVVWFLLILSSWIYKLVFEELKDNRGRGDYLKAFYAAESWIEWALLDIKDVWYAYYDEILGNKNERSIVLSDFPLDQTKMNNNKDPFVSYLIDTKTNTYSWVLNSWEHVIIPLYSIDKNKIQYDCKDLELNVTSSNSESLVWNIVGEEFWLSGYWEFDDDMEWSYKHIDTNGDLNFSKMLVGDFLNSSQSNYLIFFNSHPSEQVFYTISSKWDNFFTKPVWDIYASWKIGSYKQNIVVSLDNTSYLNILKYSIFSD